MKKLTLLALGVLSLNACTVGPDYKRPPIEAPQNFVAQDVLWALNAENKNSPVNLDWWSGFDDPILNELVAAALEHNLEVSAALARVKEAEARIGLADSVDDLSLDGSVDSEIEERRELNDGQDGATSRSVFGRLGLGLSLDVFGRTRRDVERANANLEAAEGELKSILLIVSSDVATEYLSLRGNQRQLELLRESVTLQEKTLSIVNTRFETGLAPDLDLQRARASVETLRARIPLLEERLRNSRNRLAVLTGEFPGIYEELLGAHQSIPVYGAEIPNVMPLDVLNTRPDIRQSEAQLKAAVAAIGVAEADFYPSFDLAGNLSLGASGTSSMPGTEVLIASLSALIEQVFLDGGARSANLKIAKAQAEEALANYELSLRTGVNEVEVSLNTIQASVSRQKSLDIAVQSNQRSFSQAQILYQQGLISFLDVVSAQQDLADAKQNLAVERTDYATEIATLFRVLGTDIEYIRQ